VESDDAGCFVTVTDVGRYIALPTLLTRASDYLVSWDLEYINTSADPASAAQVNDTMCKPGLYDLQKFLLNATFAVGRRARRDWAASSDRTRRGGGARPRALWWTASSGRRRRAPRVGLGHADAEGVVGGGQLVG
jgi:hypothetical protein